MNDHQAAGFSPTRRVLVVDGDDTCRGDCCTVLREAGYAVTEATGALAAMRAVLAASIDVVGVDLVLPDGHGVDVGRAFRAVATTRDICVVAMTSQPESVEFVDPHSFGAEKILLKPVDPESLLEAVEHCFGDDNWTTGEFGMPSRPSADQL